MTSTRSAPSLERSPTPDEPSSAREAPVAQTPRPLTTWRLAFLLVATIACLAALGELDPFHALHAVFTRGGSTIRLQPMDHQPSFMDTSLGERLLASLTIAQAVPSRQRILVLGNSQQFDASLPRGGVPRVGERPPITSSLVQKTFDEDAPGRYAVYNGAAPNQNYGEALWQALYWFEVTPNPPRVLLLQASFDTFRKTGVRAGYQTLLEEPRYRAALEAFIRDRDRLYVADFGDAIEKQAERAAQATGTAKATVSWSPETSLRKGMEHMPLFAAREQRKASFLNMLYVMRVQVLGISPTTRRHITGAPLEQNLQALEDLIALAKRHGSEILLYNAPVNPAIDMFYPEEYEGYVNRLSALCGREKVPFADLFDAVPAELWGYWIDGPDPIHFSEQGHRVVHARLAAELLPMLRNRR